MSIPVDSVPEGATPKQKKAMDDDMKARIKRAEAATVPQDVPTSKDEPVKDPDGVE